MTRSHSIEHYEQWARRGLEASESMWVRWNDPAVGKTVAVCVGGEWSDPLAMSNMNAALNILAEHVITGLVSEETVGRSGMSWLRLLAIHVYDDEGNITEAWKDACDNVFEPLQDYPILDEDDYSQRQYDQFVEHLRFTFGDAADLVESVLSDAGVYNSDDYTMDEVLSGLNEHLESTGETLTEEQVLGLAFEVKRAARFEPGRYPALEAAVLTTTDQPS